MKKGVRLFPIVPLGNNNNKLEKKKKENKGQLIDLDLGKLNLLSMVSHTVGETRLELHNFALVCYKTRLEKKSILIVLSLFYFIFFYFFLFVFVLLCFDFKMFCLD